MPLPNTRWPNSSRPNGPPPLSVRLSDNFDIELTVYEEFDEDNDIRLDLGALVSVDNDVRLRITEVRDENADIELTLEQPFDEDADVRLQVFNPLPMDENCDILLQTWPEDGIGYDDNFDVLLTLVEAVLDLSDIRLTLTEQTHDLSDIRLNVEQPINDLCDVVIRTHTDLNDATVRAIATIIERRFLPYFKQNVMFKPGADTLRYQLFHAAAVAEKTARDQLERMLDHLRLTTAYGAALDWVGDRVGELRWRFYDDRTDRYESDDNFRTRLIPYFREGRGDLPSLQAAVDALHDCYGGATAFFWYTVGEGWMLGDGYSGQPIDPATGQRMANGGRSQLGLSTRLGGALENLNVLEYLQASDIWVLGSGLRQIEGTTNPIHDRDVLTGVGTNFLQDVHEDDYLYVYWAFPSGEWHYIGQVDRVVSNDKLVLKQPVTSGYSGQIFFATAAKIPDGTTSPGTPSHTVLGKTTYLGDRERLGPFTFVVLVTNYPQDDRWRELFLHTIDRFKAAGTVPIVIFRSATMLQQVLIAGSGAAAYYVTGKHLQGENVIIFIDGVGQEPGTYALYNDGSDTRVEFSEAVAAGLNIVINWVEEAV